MQLQTWIWTRHSVQVYRYVLISGKQNKKKIIFFSGEMIKSIKNSSPRLWLFHRASAGVWIRSKFKLSKIFARDIGLNASRDRICFI